MAIKLITFDLDNTLWENNSVIQRAEQSCYDFLVQQAPAIKDAYPLEELQSLRRTMMEEKPYLAAQVSKVRKLAIQKALETICHTKNEIPALVDACFENFLSERNTVNLFPETIPLLKDLSEKYLLASLTNGNSNLSIIGIDKYFSFSLSAEKVGASKPRPNIFHAALERAKISSNEMLHIGDHPIDDICGAQQLGIHTIWFNPENKKWSADDGRVPSASVKCLSEIPEKIINLVAK